MKGGTAMLVATIMTTLTAPTAEAEMLSTKANTCFETLANKVDKTQHALKTLEQRKVQLDELLANFRQYYYDISNDANLVDLNEYENIFNLDLTARGIGELLKGILKKEELHIKAEYGNDVYQSFRHLVATHGQVRKNMSNILSVYKNMQGMVETVEQTAFTPTKEFFTAAFEVSENVYNTH
ncbi:hypothetical protein [Shewanella polaris]|uniref:Uncharacterized protein n=1 Tax=Shewanella polaris TaxID=2588449 RepID=A0A4Y5YHX5_9GAMM|nr:hypothetical protein [Shewanella polaris]QDE32412.1 hypothetical protein FH971_16445 [Shewanella polaris]|tara:strand:+ start:2778 stop:3323 length:546 start_codon:yes stop_codon:yes gene_type:complete